MLLHSGKWTLAVNLEWSMPNNAREVSAEKKANPRSAFVLAKQDRQQWLGVHASFKGVAYAGALLIGMVKPNAIIVHGIDEDNAWVCAIQDGMPVVGYDRLLPPLDARREAIEWSASMFDKAELFGDFTGAHGTLNDLLGQIDEALRTKALKKKQLSNARLQKEESLLFKVVVIGAFALMGVGGYVGFKVYKDRQRSAEAQERSLLEAAQQAMAAAQGKALADANRKTHVAAFEQEVVSARHQYERRVDPSQLWAGASSVRRVLPLSKHSYRPQSVECTASGCRVTWQGAPSALVADKLTLPYVESSFSTDATAVSNFPLSVATDTLPGQAGQFKSVAELKFWLHSNFGPRTNGYGAIFDDAQPVTITPPPDLGLQPVTVAYVGKWRANIQGGSALLKGAELAGALSRWPVSATLVRFSGGSSVELSGDYIFVGER